MMYSTANTDGQLHFKLKHSTAESSTLAVNMQPNIYSQTQDYKAFSLNSQSKLHLYGGVGLSAILQQSQSN